MQKYTVLFARIACVDFYFFYPLYFPSTLLHSSDYFARGFCVSFLLLLPTLTKYWLLLVSTDLRNTNKYPVLQGSLVSLVSSVLKEYCYFNALQDQRSKPKVSQIPHTRSHPCKSGIHPMENLSNIFFILK